MRMLLAGLALAALVGAWVPVAAQDARDDRAQPAPALTESQKANVAVLDTVIDTIRRRFFDRTYRGKDLADMHARYLPRVTASAPGEPLYKVLREMLGEFKVSHLTIVAEDVFNVNFAPEMENTRSLRPGLEVTEPEPGRFFICSVMHGSAADSAGVLRGDRLVEINGKPAAESGLLADAGGDPGLPGDPHYFVRVPESGELELKLQRRPEDRELTTIRFTATETNMIEATRNSVRVIEFQGRRYGYIRFWHFLHNGITSALRHGLTEVWKDCDGLVIDLRGRGGSVSVMNACFAPFGDPPGTMGGRVGRRSTLPKWAKPVVALQDGGSRSAKEVYAHNWKWLQIGPLVGETSAGAVIGSQFVPLPDGSRLMLAAQNVRNLAYGQVELEANGVEPTHPVKDLLPFAAGEDTILQAGLRILHRQRPAQAVPPPAPVNPQREEEFGLAPVLPLPVRESALEPSHRLRRVAFR